MTSPRTEQGFLNWLKKQNNKNMYNLTCIITGKKDNLKMHAHRNNSGEIVGWVFLHESVDIKNLEINWSWKVTPGETKVEVKP